MKQRLVIEERDARRDRVNFRDHNKEGLHCRSRPVPQQLPSYNHNQKHQKNQEHQEHQSHRRNHWFHRRQQQKVTDVATIIKPGTSKKSFWGRPTQRSENEPAKQKRKWFSFGKKKTTTETADMSKGTKAEKKHTRKDVPTAESIEVILCPSKNGKRVLKIAMPKRPVIDTVH